MGGDSFVSVSSEQQTFLFICFANTPLLLTTIVFSSEWSPVHSTRSLVIDGSGSG